MTRTKPFRLGGAFAVTVGVGYALCTVVFWLCPEAAAAFMNALFHGLDFTPLANVAAFTFGSFAFAFVVLVAWAFMLGTLFAWVADRMAREA
jgi:hypothetical protein